MAFTWCKSQMECIPAGYSLDDIALGYCQITLEDNPYRIMNSMHKNFHQPIPFHRMQQVGGLLVHSNAIYMDRIDDIAIIVFYRI